jgi:2-polyprenyl-3-methyl-5-hydroxy-6-metoxy-1,4-benzoquinol methylase
MARLHPIEWDDEKVARLWDYYSKLPHVQALYFAKVWGGAILRRAGLPRGGRLSILDFGCGPGHMFEHVKRASPRWTYSGLEFSSASVAELVARHSADPQFQQGVEAKQLPSALPAGSFDVVLLIEVIEHLAEERVEAVLGEIRRLLKPGGLLVVTAPNDEDLSLEAKLCPECGAEFHQWQHVRSWTLLSLGRLLEGRRFSRVKTWTGHWNDHRAIGWLYNRLAGFYTGLPAEPHLMAVYRSDP